MLNTGVPDGEPRNVTLVVTPDSEADSEDAEQLVRQLRSTVAELDVESVKFLWPDSEEVPKGAKGEPLTLGGLLVTLGAAGGVFTALIETLRDWLGRQATANRTRISVTIDGDTLELDHATALERRELIGEFVRRHATG